MTKKIICLIVLHFFVKISVAQDLSAHRSLIRSFKPNFSTSIRHIDLDKDGDPDLIQATINDSINLIWIDDDDDMLNTDIEGDMDNDCLIIDRNKDGKFAGPGDLSLDWVDNDSDGIPEMQVVVENSNPNKTNFWDWSSNYMWIIDEEKDGAFHYIDWNELILKCWTHYGASNFYEDYQGQTLFLKASLPSYRYSDLRFSWENPFLFYDLDDDGLSEISIRLVDSGRFEEKKSNDPTKVDTYPNGKIDKAFVSIDLDNDNGASNEFDFDMSIHFSGEGFPYSNQAHKFNNMRGLPEADSLFFDSRWRQMNELIYTGHDEAWNKIFKDGKWEQCWFVFDEDDDCERWERVEFYKPMDPFIIGMHDGGLDDNPQADASGDRGEWDMDNSGKGSLYIGFDGKVHLYGAELAYWRIDQDAWSYQGWGGLYEDGYKRLQKIPNTFPTIGYEDTNGDGFFNVIKYDLDGDKHFEQMYNLDNLKINSQFKVIETRNLGLKDLNKLFEVAVDHSWEQAMNAVNAAKCFNINYLWYYQFLHPKSLNQKYQFAYWIQFYLFSDFMKLANEKKDEQFKTKILKAYFGQDWKILEK